MTDPRTELRQAIIGQLSRPIDDIETWADNMIAWLEQHGWRPPDRIPDWRETRRDPPPPAWHTARAALHAQETL